ncbi:hypothetical protein LTR91_003176 [Friedmanniomyces endolithicus]|uniref:Uncharacterized protein n=1 Tax=Friedmanniomyces endolithicus TaxID=329885 RepID=A0AAN6FEN6_9PEZI|nr:hypothetical protein LTS00_016028 [Friedmanniomyces endolithicus]KAK0274204.1 hypothetical protein LTR35_011713 [Friedmanniomyces endolithicus]KAK0311736.1 hypothetical protein LTR82_014108 [Friedmanniomyces endolithicus]KAK0910979.1 hypothetical protein LTR57_015613 [Friedmanniomyces endolithicus]KAK0983590.1 hypothetical protein LTR54_014255 [Friedmanniomyces endolithicus]
MSATDRAALNAATKRHTERTTRLSTLRTILEEAGWDDRHPYIKAVIKGNSISVIKGNKLKDELQRKLKAATMLECYAAFTISNVQISREDIEAAEKNYSGYIRFSDDNTLLSLETNIDPNDLPALPPYRREIEDAVGAATAAAAAGGVEYEDEVQQDAEQEPNRGTSRVVRKRRTSASPPMATTGHTRATAKKPTPKKAKTAADADADAITNWKRLCNIVSLENTATHGKSITEIAHVRQTAIDVAISIGDYAVCHSHCFIFATHAGIYKGAMQQDQLLKIIKRYAKQDNGYLASDEAAELIKRSYCDEHRYDSYGLAQVKPSPAARLHNLHHELAMRLLEEMFPGMRKIWERNGDIVSDIFGWIFSNEEVVTAIEYEVDMYDYYFRVKSG